MAAMVTTKSSTPPALYSQTEKIKKEISILDNLKKFIPPLSAEERQQLEQNILEFGCKDSLTIWETTEGVISSDSKTPDLPKYILIDGHNRYEICQKYGIDFKILIVEFENLDKVYDFMIDHQLGRRNLSPEQMSYLRGLKYNSLKKNEVQRDSSGKFLSDEKPSGQSDQTAILSEVNQENLPSGQNDQAAKKQTLSEQLAEQFNVGEKTIRRDAAFAKGLEMLPSEIKSQVLQGKSILNKAQIIELSKLKDKNEIELFINRQSKENDSIVVQTEDDNLKKEKERISILVKSISKPKDCDFLIKELRELKNKMN